MKLYYMEWREGLTGQRNTMDSWLLREYLIPSIPRAMSAEFKQIVVDEFDDLLQYSLNRMAYYENIVAKIYNYRAQGRDYNDEIAQAYFAAFFVIAEPLRNITNTLNLDDEFADSFDYYCYEYNDDLLPEFLQVMAPDSLNDLIK